MAMDWIGGTRMKEWLPMAQNVISRYAKDHNCKYLEVMVEKVGVVGLASTGGSQTILLIKWSCRNG